MWYLSKIPKVLHLYWGGKSLSYLRYLTAYSFAKYNPDWLIKVHTPIKIYEPKTWRTHEHKNFIPAGRDYFGELKELGVSFKEHDFTNYRFINEVSETYKADFLRWKLLSEEGGVWSDFDIIYTKPMNSMNINREENSEVDTGICVYSNRLSAIGFIFGNAGNEFWKYVNELCYSRFDPTNYQSIGSNLLNGKFDSIIKIKNAFSNLKPIYIDPKTVYLLDASVIDQFYTTDALDILEDENAIGFHWYAGHSASQQYESSVNEQNYRSYKNTISRIMRGVFE